MTTLPTLHQAKLEAAALRNAAGHASKDLTNAQSLELISHQYGYRDWNSLSAAIKEQNRPQWQIGQQVTGRYIGQPFSATVKQVKTISPGWHWIALDPETAVDVVTFDSFSAFRKAVSGNIGPKGQSREKTSNGAPQLSLDLH